MALLNLCSSDFLPDIFWLGKGMRIVCVWSGRWKWSSAHIASIIRGWWRCTMCSFSSAKLLLICWLTSLAQSSRLAESVPPCPALELDASLGLWWSLPTFRQDTNFIKFGDGERQIRLVSSLLAACSFLQFVYVFPHFPSIFPFWLAALCSSRFSIKWKHKRHTESFHSSVTLKFLQHCI